MQFTQAISLLLLSTVSLTGVTAAPTKPEDLAPRAATTVFEGVRLFLLIYEILSNYFLQFCVVAENACHWYGEHKNGVCTCSTGHPVRSHTTLRSTGQSWADTDLQCVTNTGYCNYSDVNLSCICS